MKKITLYLFLLVSLYATAAQDTTIIRGPYIQAGTTNSMVIRWRSSNSTVGTVNYGMQVGQQTSTLSETSATTEHEIKVTGLQPNTLYYYTIYNGTTLLAGGDNTYRFKTEPIPGTVQPVHVWVTGDMGRNTQPQWDVRDTYWNNIRNGRQTDAWIWLGDNVYSSGTDQEYQEKMFEVYPEILRSTTSRPCPGNHDYGSINAFSHDGPYYQNFTLPKNGEAGGVPSNEEGYYSYDVGNVHFISLDSEVLPWFITANSQMCSWLKQDLAATTQPWKIVYWHQPPFTKGSHDSDGQFSNMGFMRTNIVPILEQYGVDMVLCGHSHNYERSFLVKGHYGDAIDFDISHVVNGQSGKESLNEAYTKYTTGPNANKGTVYVVCGNGGSTTSGRPLNHPMMYFNQQDSAGFMTIDVNDMKLVARYYDSQGTLWDDFTIQKTTQNPNGITSLNDFIDDLTVFPNPFSTQLTVEVTMLQAQPALVNLIDIHGKVVANLHNGQLAQGLNRFTYNASQLPAGNYIVSIKHAQLGETTRLVTLSR